MLYIIALKVWNSDVRFYCVKDSSRNPIAYFYFDPYSRPSEKKGGAWMDEVFSRSQVMAQKGSSVRLPVAQMVCNQTPPVGDKPSLMTFGEVKNIFNSTSVGRAIIDFEGSMETVNYEVNAEYSMN